MDIIDIKYIWFDLGYTLLYLNRELPYQAALRELGIEVDLELIERGFHFTDKLFMREYPGCLGKDPAGYMPWYIGRLNYHLGIQPGIQKLITRWMEIREKNEHQWYSYPFVKDTLGNLIRSGYKLGVISNWNNTARGILDYCELTSFFSTIIISSEIGIEKPDPDIFRAAFRESGSNSEEGLYVGDNYYDDHVGAGRVGMDTIIINRYGEFGIEELNECRIIPDVRGLNSLLKVSPCC